MIIAKVFNFLQFIGKKLNKIIKMTESAGQRLLRVIETLKMTQVEFAEEISKFGKPVHQTTASYWINKKIHFSPTLLLRLEPFFKKYNLNINYLNDPNQPMTDKKALSDLPLKDQLLKAQERLLIILEENDRLRREIETLRAENDRKELEQKNARK